MMGRSYGYSFGIRPEPTLYPRESFKYYSAAAEEDDIEGLATVLSNPFFFFLYLVGLTKKKKKKKKKRLEYVIETDVEWRRIPIKPRNGFYVQSKKVPLVFFFFSFSFFFVNDVTFFFSP